MKRADSKTFGRIAAEQLAYPLLHLPRRFIGKGHGRNVIGIDAAGLYQIGNLLSDNTGFTAAGTGENQHGAVDIAHGLTLSWVQLWHAVIDS